MLILRRLLPLITGFLVLVNVGDVFSETTAGALSGRIEYKGLSQPKPEKVPVSVNQEQCGTQIESENLIIGTGNKGIKNVVITLERQDLPSPYDVSSSFFDLLKTKKCRFSPHIMVIPKGTSLNLQNEDRVFHNVHFSMENDSPQNLPLATANVYKTKPFKEAGVVHVTCNIHPFMQGTVIVTDAPYYAITNEEGAFSFTDLPPGKYLLKIWHELFKSIEKNIEIKPNVKLNLSFGLKEH